MSETMLQAICRKMQNACQIDPLLFEKYNVKRGLRNPDHTGVLVGLTSIGDVVGYRTEKGRIVPIEGELFYRGYRLDDLVAGAQRGW
jgi:citrate synthase